MGEKKKVRFVNMTSVMTVKCAVVISTLMVAVLFTEINVFTFNLRKMLN